MELNLHIPTRRNKPKTSLFIIVSNLFTTSNSQRLMPDTHTQPLHLHQLQPPTSLVQIQIGP